VRQGAAEKEDNLTNKLVRLAKDETGLSTAEYAVGTVAVVGLGGLMLKLLTSDWFAGLLKSVFEWAFQSVLG
jgi:Flp pilus assembly pilin Flp